MKFGNRASMAVLAVLVALPVAAQNRGAERGSEVNAEAIEVQMREAEERLAEAAAQVAELSSRRLPIAVGFHGHMRDRDRPMLGVAIGTEDEEGPVEGVTIRGVTPGSAADDAGLRAGDVLTAVNDESLSAGSGSEANEKLLDFMAGIEPGDSLDVEYLRDGEVAAVELEPRPAPGFVRAFRGRNWPMPPPAVPGERFFGFFTSGGSWGDMEMVPLTEELGRYFGTDTGLLVVRAPADDSLKLQDGDVIQSIDGREPASVAHAMRILGSYQGGETLDIEIMRDRKQQTVSIEMPDRRQGNVRHFEFPAPTVAPPMEALPTVIMTTPEDRI